MTERDNLAFEPLWPVALLPSSPFGPLLLLLCSSCLPTSHSLFPPMLASNRVNSLLQQHRMSKYFKILLPAAAIAGGAYYYQTLNTPAPPPVFTGDGQWIDLKLTNVKPVTHDSSIYTFAFPDANQKSGLITASCILTKYVTAKGNNVIRPYTPITDNDQKGSFDLLVKTYPNGKMSVHIHDLKINDTLAFKGPNIKWKWETNQFKEITLIGGGSGITPLYQLIHKILSDPADKTKITLLYGNKTPEDILLKSTFDELKAKYPDQFTVQYFVDKVDDPSKATDVTVGYINKDVLEKTLPKKSPESHIYVCGPKPLYEAISGNKISPSDQGEVTGILKELGYDKTDVFKF